MTTSLLQDTASAHSMVTMTVPNERVRRRDRRGENRKKVVTRRL